MVLVPASAVGAFGVPVNWGLSICAYPWTLTNAVVAIWVLLVAASGLVDVGVPDNVGLINGAKVPVTQSLIVFPISTPPHFITCNSIHYMCNIYIFFILVNVLFNIANTRDYSIWNSRYVYSILSTIG